MPKDAAMNAGGKQGVSDVFAYKDTLSAVGAIDMWGNVWEWTSSSRSGGKAVKGGSYKTAKTSCRTENRSEARKQTQGYDDVGLRLVLEK